MHITINKTEVAIVELLAGIALVLILAWLGYQR
jgi:hypothetical protein